MRTKGSNGNGLAGQQSSPVGSTGTERAVAILTFTCLLGFVLLAIMVQLGHGERLDRAILLLLRESGDANNPLGPPWFEEAAAEFTALGGYTILTTVTVIVVSTLLLLRKFAAAGFLLAAVISGSLLSSLAKRVFERARPDFVGHLDVTFTSSFPSAHAMVGTFTWLTLAAIAARFIEQRGLRIFMLAAASVMAILIGSSRVYLGVHWPSDVLAGWFLGVAWAGACWLVANRLGRRHGARDDSTDLGN